MTKLLERAIEFVRQLPPEGQDAIAREMLAHVDDREAEEIDPADLEAVMAAIAEVDAGKIATDEEVEAAFGRFLK
jgi:hypothetical protein